MRRDRSGWWSTVCLALGGAGIVLGAETTWPNPLADARLSDAQTLLRLRAAAAAIDAACRDGDLAAFAACTTTGHQRRLARALAAVDRRLDETTLVAIAGEQPYGDLLRGRPLAGEVRGDRAVVAVARPRGDGAQLVEFVWDGRRLRLDESRHARSVHDPAAARAAVDAALQRAEVDATLGR